MSVTTRSHAFVSVFIALLVLAGATGFGSRALAQPYGEPDRDSPGDAMIQAWLAERAGDIDGAFLEGIESAQNWAEARSRYAAGYRSMLGLPRDRVDTPLDATVTGRVEGDGYVVELLHYQSRPRLYVTANLYRPSEVAAGKRLPAILYVCGHSGRGRNGNKTAFQSWGMWFARHGYVCLLVDTLQLGEIAALHHGTYREQRWWWHSLGYSPSAVECLNGVRGIDYLSSRPDVDPERLAVTGISGGGAATFWVAAADDRVKVSVPVSGMADLESYVSNRVINGHCDCMFLHNTLEWPWTRIAALIAPRPLLFVNSDADPIFPMDANERIIARLERLYSLFGAGDLVDSVVSVGGHAYREDIRKAVYRFLNTHLLDDPRPVTDSEVDLVTGPRNAREHPIPPEKLRVFPTDADLPPDELNTTIDEHFVEERIFGDVAPKKDSALPFKRWKEQWLFQGLRQHTFRAIDQIFTEGRSALSDRTARTGEPFPRLDGERLETEPGIAVVLRRVRGNGDAKRRVLVVGSSLEPDTSWLEAEVDEPSDLWLVEPRGVGSTRWTGKNPPNYVERSHVLLGTTVDTGRLLDVLAAAELLGPRTPDDGSTLTITGRGAFGVLAAYAAVLTSRVDRVVVKDFPLSHRQSGAPQFLNVLRICDIPDVLGMIAPRPLRIVGGESQGALSRTMAIYEAAGARERLEVR